MSFLPTLRKRNEPSLYTRAFGDLERWLDEDFGRFFESRLPAAFQGARVPPIDVAETERDFQVSVEAPGLEEKDFQIELMGNTLVVSGERKWEQEKKGKEYRKVESQYGTFRREILLPPGLRSNPDDVSATYKNGVLEIRILKIEPTPAARIAVKKA